MATTLYRLNGKLLLHGGKLAAGPQCCICTPPPPELCPDAINWSHVSVVGFGNLLRNNDFTTACDGSTVGDPTTTQIWYGYDEVNDIEYWVYDSKLDVVSKCDPDTEGDVVYMYDVFDCAGGGSLHNEDCCLNIWDGTKYILPNNPYGEAHIYP